MSEFNMSTALEYWIGLQNITKPTQNKIPLAYEDTHQVLYDFLPIFCFPTSNGLDFKINRKIYYIDKYNYKSNENKIDDQYPIYCTFVSKPAFKNAVDSLTRSPEYFNIVGYNSTDRMDITASYLWFSRKDLYHYNTIWLYVLSKQIHDNIKKTRLTIAPNINDIVECLDFLLSKIIEFANSEGIELPEYSKKGSLILPKGILFNPTYQLRKEIDYIYDLIDLLFFEMLSIKSEYFMIVFDGEGSPMSYICK